MIIIKLIETKVCVKLGAYYNFFLAQLWENICPSITVFIVLTLCKWPDNRLPCLQSVIWIDIFSVKFSMNTFTRLKR